MTNWQQAIEEILGDFERKVFEHSMALGQEFPNDDPKKMHDPCNAEDREQTLQAIAKATGKHVVKQNGAKYDFAGNELRAKQRKELGL